ncbi:MAG: sialate O-acetylesterase [Verrucomicrobiota bacterium JB024]|nr:sialate O-acetylesterase [Verrucomicrobiota bacterium JB024]
MKKPCPLIRCLTLTLLALLFSTLASAQELRLPSVFSDHMVLQRDTDIRVWGWAPPNADVTVAFKGQSVNARADKDGRWRADLKPVAADASPVELTVTAAGKSVSVKDVLVGEVWLCSGQSNMAWPVQKADNADKEIADAQWPQIRHIEAPRTPNMQPQDDSKTQWEVCSPETVGSFTAVGYFFGRRLHQELGVPVGLINCSWGGTKIEPWTPLEGFAEVPELKSIYQEVLTKQPGSAPYQKAAGQYLSSMKSWLPKAEQAFAKESELTPPPDYPEAIKPYTSHQSPTMLYNGMMSPFTPFAIKGSIWYQGEANRNEGMAYLYKTEALLAGWYKVWEHPDLPYYFVQIAPYKGSNTDALPEFWEAQRAIEQQLPHTGMIVISDIGNINNIHPTNKQGVGLRLANMALKRDYGRSDLIDMGPRFRDMEVSDGKVLVHFDDVADGLSARDGKHLSEFEIAGEGQPWAVAQARIVSKDTVELSSPSVPNPSAIRFGWVNVSTPNLMNSAGLPAAPFRAGELADTTGMLMNVPEAKDYEIVYELDLNKMGKSIAYDTDNSGKIVSPYDRIAYYLELTDDKGETQWAFVSMDAFTNDVKKIGVPTAASGASFQQYVTGVNVRSNVDGVPNKDGLKGNLEFWPNNYAQANSANIPGASNDKFDNGDRPDPNRADGYGSMQVHIVDPVVTVFAVNHWTTGNGADLGIGTNKGSGQPDWTFTKSASRYSVKQLKVLVHPKN